MLALPAIMFGKGTIFRYVQFIKYIYPYYDITVKVFFQNSSQQYKEITEAMGLKKPEGETILINIIIYLVLLICL